MKQRVNQETIMQEYQIQIGIQSYQKEINSQSVTKETCNRLFNKTISKKLDKFWSIFNFDSEKEFLDDGYDH